MRKVVGDVQQPEFLDQPPGSLFAPGRCPRQTSRKQDILGPAQLLDQMKGLKYEPDVPEPRAREGAGALGGEPLPGEGYLARVRLVESSKEMQKRRLAAPRTPEHSHHLARLDVECHAVQYQPLRPPPPDGLGDPARFENGHRFTVPSRRGASAGAGARMSGRVVDDRDVAARTSARPAARPPPP